MRLRPYPKYKWSGVEWLSEVPEHWEIGRLKDRALVVGGQSPSSDLVRRGTHGLPFLQGNAEFGIRHPVATKVCDAASRTARTGDILLSVRAPVGALNVADQPYGIGRGLVAIRCEPATIRGSFLFYFATVARAQLHAVATGSTYDAVSVADVGNLPLAHPEYEEQRRIGAYLDTEVERMDSLAQKQTRLIECLREKRSALITRAVTRGLPPKEARAAGFDPAPPLRASGVEWLGDIPDHWEVKRLKYLATINDEVLPDITPLKQEMHYVDIGSVDSVKGITTSEPLTFESAPSRARRIVRKGDTIVSTVRTYLRAISAIREPVENLIVSTGFAVVRPRRMEPGYLSYAARESRFVETVVARSVGVSYPAVNASEIATIPVPRPPEAEQRAIADYLDRETAKLDHLVEKVETAIERLREYRSALITAVVTGKVDVRGASGETGRAAAG